MEDYKTKAYHIDRDEYTFNEVREFLDIQSNNPWMEAAVHFLDCQTNVVERLTAELATTRTALTTVEAEATWWPTETSPPKEDKQVLVVRTPAGPVLQAYFVAKDQWDRPNMFVIGGGFNEANKLYKWRDMPKGPSACTSCASCPSTACKKEQTNG